MFCSQRTTRPEALGARAAGIRIALDLALQFMSLYNAPLHRR